MELRLHELHYNLGCVLHQQKDLVEAVASYQQALALHEAHVPTHLNLAIVLSEMGDCRSAISHFRRAIALQPDYIAAYNGLGSVLFNSGDRQTAIETFQQAITLRPDWAILHCNLGQALSQSNIFEAIAAYRHAIQLQPDLEIAHYCLGLALQQQGQHHPAIDCFQRVLELNAQHLTAASDCGVSWLALGQTDRALACWQQAVLAQSELAEAYCQLSQSLLGADELQRAKIACGLFLKALQHGDRSSAATHLASAYTHWGNVLMSYGGQAHYRQAERYYQQALQLQPTQQDSQNLYICLGDCLTRQRRQEAALLTYHAAAALVPNEAHPLMRLGTLLEASRPDRAVAYYRQAFQKQSQSSSKAEFANLPLVSTAPAIVKGYYSTTGGWSRSNSLARYTPLSSNAAEVLHPASDPQPPAEPVVGQNSLQERCEGLNCISCLDRLQRTFQPVHLGQGVSVCKPIAHPSKEQNITSNKFVTVIPNGRVWNVPQQSAWMLCNAIATFSPDDYLLADLSRDYPGELPGCEQANPHQHRVFEEAELPPLQQISGKVAALPALSGNVYFHWLVDVLPRLEILRRGDIDLAEIDKFWMPEPQAAFQQESLQLLGVPLERVLSADRYPHIQAERLIAPSFSGYLGWVESWALKFLRQTFLPTNASQSSLPKRLYISRSGARYRQVLNEAEVIAFLQPFGFVVVRPETLSFQEQIALFAQAEAIVAPHGGGLTNTLFCQAGTIVIELFSPHYIRYYYWVISRLLKLHHFSIVGESFTCTPIRQLMYPSPLAEDIWIKIDSLAAALRWAKLT